MVPPNKIFWGDKWISECKNKWNLVSLFLNKEKKGYTMLNLSGQVNKHNSRDLVLGRQEVECVSYADIRKDIFFLILGQTRTTGDLG